MTTVTLDRGAATRPRLTRETETQVQPESSSARKAAIVLSSLEASLAARLLAILDRSIVEAVTLQMAQLGPVDPDERNLVLDEFYELGRRRLQFTFDDLVRMEESDLKTAVHEEDLNIWALALAGSAQTTRAKVQAAIGPELERRLVRALENLGPFRLSDSEAAQHEIAELLRGLHDRGRINLPEPAPREEAVA